MFLLFWLDDGRLLRHAGKHVEVAVVVGGRGHGGRDQGCQHRREKVNSPVSSVLDMLLLLGRTS